VVYRHILNFILLVFLILGFSENSYALKDKGTISIEGFGVINYTADRLRLSLKDRTAELEGNVEVVHGDQVLRAEYAWLDQKNGDLRASGNVTLKKNDIVMVGSRLEYNVNTELGTMYNGSVSNSKYTLYGELIEKKGPLRFETEEGEYSTCKDCPKSWSLSGRSMDLEVEGYAFIKDMLLMVNEIPVFYFPYLIFPVKTERQSGFLFPRFGSSEDLGFRYVQPYFWAISRNQDATLYAGHLSKRGWKFGQEYRLILDNNGSEANGQFWQLNDVNSEGVGLRPYAGWRWGMDWWNKIYFSDVFSNRFKYTNISDSDYLRQIGDVPGNHEESLQSFLKLDAHSDPVHAQLAAHRFRSFLSPKAEDPSLREFPVRTVQLLPQFTLGTNRFKLVQYGNISSWFDADMIVSRFWRQNGTVWDDGINTSVGFNRDSEIIFKEDEQVFAVRQANRLVFNPKFSIDYRIFDRFVLRPSYQYNYRAYQFGSNVFTTGSNNFARGWPLFETSLETTVEKVYHLEDDGEEIEEGSIEDAYAGRKLRALKHSVTPEITYFNIAQVHSSNPHPFLNQLEAPGGNFDEYDIVPLSEEEIGDSASPSAMPLENTLSFGMNNSLFGRWGELENARYDDILSWNVSQAIDLERYEATRNPKLSLSQFVSRFRYKYPGWVAGNDYVYNPRNNTRVISANLTKTFADYKRDVFFFKREITFSYAFNNTNQDRAAETTGIGSTYSFNDFWSVGAGGNYSITNKKWWSWIFKMGYAHPGRCWGLFPSIRWTRDTQDVTFSLNLAVNLIGDSLIRVSGPYQDSSNTGL
jgi:LPS-assembly protein